MTVSQYRLAFRISRGFCQTKIFSNGEIVDAKFDSVDLRLSRENRRGTKWITVWSIVYTDRLSIKK